VKIGRRVGFIESDLNEFICARREVVGQQIKDVMEIESV
jgi:hypothetical protein